MAEVGRNLWRSSSPIPLLRQSHLEPVAPENVQMAFEYLQRWRLHNLPGPPMPVLSHPHSKKVFLDVQMAPSVFQFVSLGLCASGPVTGHH